MLRTSQKSQITEEILSIYEIPEIQLVNLPLRTLEDLFFVLSLASYVAVSVTKYPRLFENTNDRKHIRKISTELKEARQTVWRALRGYGKTDYLPVMAGYPHQGARNEPVNERISIILPSLDLIKVLPSLDIVKEKISDFSTVCDILMTFNAQLAALDRITATSTDYKRHFHRTTEHNLRKLAKEHPDIKDHYLIKCF